MLTLLLLTLHSQAPQLSDAPVLEQPAVLRDLTGMTREQLEQENLRLTTERPNFLVPALVMIGGGVLGYGGLALFVGWIAESLQGFCISFGFGCTSQSQPNPNVQRAFLTSGFVSLGLGITGLIAGGVLLKLRGIARAPYSKAIEAVDARLEELDGLQDPKRPQRLDPPPASLAPL